MSALRVSVEITDDIVSALEGLGPRPMLLALDMLTEEQQELLLSKILTHLRNLLPAFKPGTSIRVSDLDTGEGGWSFDVRDNRKHVSARRKRYDRLVRQ